MMRKNEPGEGPDHATTPEDVAIMPAMKRVMQVLVVRHGVAEEGESWEGRRDRARPLTGAGRKKLKRAARGVARLVPAVDLVVTSPLVRAVQSADVLAEAFGGVKTLACAALAPGKGPAALLAYLQALRPGGAVALVGHEPDLGLFVSWALTGLKESFVPLKKGGACLVEFAEELRPGRAKLLWSAKPALLRKIGK